MLFDSVVLYSDWVSANNNLGVIPSLREFLRVCRKYSEPHRHYHTLKHLTHCMRELNTHFHHVKGLPMIKMAFFFHDIVYDVTSKANEQDSADDFIAFADRIGLYDYDVRRTVYDLIMLTASHKLPGNASTLEKVMNDVDMSIFTSLGGEYVQYAQNIWREYQSVGREAYVKGRSDFLRSVNPYDMFYTAHYRAAIPNAHLNIESELALLQDESAVILV